MSDSDKGVLYLCPTPIGNLDDITFRALNVLKEVDLIAAEDTRVTIKLLNHFEIKTPLTSYHEHNKISKGPKLINMLNEGKSIALVTDAGTPALSDPGEDLVQDAIKEEIKVVPLPGAAAAVCALVASGLSTRRFAFEGFLPSKQKEKKEFLTKIAKDERTLIFYEAPHRIAKTLKTLFDIFGNRKIVIAREMTKVHEEFMRGTIEEIIEKFEASPPKGEMVLVVEGFTPCKNLPESAKADEDELKASLQSIIKEEMSKGFTKNQALKRAAKQVGVSRNEAYEILIEK